MNEELKVILSAEIDKLKKGLAAGQKAVQSFSNVAKSVGKGVGTVMKGIGTATATAMKATATAVATGATALVGLAESTKEYRTTMAKLETAFESVGSSAEQAKETYNDLYRVLGDTDVAVEAANHLAQLTTNEQDLAEWTRICQGVYATFGDSLPIEGLAEAANETAKTGQVTGVFADALNWGALAGETFGVTLKAATKENEAWNKAVMACTSAEDYFNLALQQCNSEAEREALIRKTLSRAYGEAADLYEENAAGLLRANEAQSRMNEALAALGELAEPIVTELKMLGASLLEDLVPGLTLVSEGLQDMGKGVEGGAEKLSEGLTMMIESVLTRLNEMLPTLLEIGVQVMMSIITGIANTIPTVVETIVGLIPTIIEYLTTTLPQLLEMGVQVIQTILTGIRTSGPELIDAVTGLIPLVIEAITTVLPELLQTGIAMVYYIIMGVIQSIPEVVAAFVAMIPEIIQALVTGADDLFDVAIELFLAIAEAIPEVIPVIAEAVPEIITRIVDVISEKIPLLLDAAVQLFTAIVDAIPEIIPPLIEALPEIIDTILTALIENIPVLLDAAIELFFAIIEAIPQIIPDLVGALPEIIDTIIDAVFDAVPMLLEAALDLFATIPEAIFETIPNIISACGEIVANIITHLVNKALEAMDFDWSLPKPSWPYFTVSGGQAPWGFLGKGSLPKISLHWNAKGGVFDSPTIFPYGDSLQGLGEDGAEAIVPLEKNTQWLDRIAEKLNEKQGSQPIVLQVDGKTFAQISVDSINQLTRQRGSLALNLV